MISGPASLPIGRPVSVLEDLLAAKFPEFAMNRSLGLIIIPLFLALAGCSGDADKGIIQNKEKPVAPAPEKPADIDKK
jgi:hypothetical protein